MANNNDFSSAVGALFKGMDNFITTKTVVGEPQKVGDTIILPLVDVSFGVGAGAFSNDNGKKNNGGGGLGGKITPSAVLVIQNGQTKLVNIRNQETITKVLDMVPDVVDKVSGFFSGKIEDDITEETLFADEKTDSADVKKEEI